jgi:hypothetical protein
MVSPMAGTCRRDYCIRLGKMCKVRASGAVVGG